MPAISSVSGNGCTGSTPNRIRTGSGWQLRDYTEAERTGIEARFRAKVKQSDGCWLWTGSLDRSGYGQLGARHLGHFSILKAHRLAWELEYGPIPHGLQLNHKCDVARCARPEHLYLGTQQQNLNDARRRGRLNESLPRTNKLTLEERLAIYAMPERRGICVELALRYRVSKTTISLTRRGRFRGSPFYRIGDKTPVVQHGPVR